MIVEYIRYQVAPDKLVDFEKAWEQAGGPLLASPHCLGYEVSHSSEDPGAFIIRIQWDSADGHLNGFRKSPEFRQFFALVSDYYNSIQEMRHYDIVTGRSRE
jgi:quinol monooxygenase YgiN